MDLTSQQLEVVSQLLALTDAAGEPMASRWKPEAFDRLLQSCGFKVVEHADETILMERYFKGRNGGLYPGLPLRVLVAERCDDS